MPAPSLPLPAAPAFELRAGWRELRAREPRLAAFGVALLVALLPALLALWLDERRIGSASVWLKPLKFYASVGLFALTTAWFVGLLPAAQRRGRVVALVAWTIIGAGAYEVGYITLQALLGEASHYNFSTPLHVALYNLMGAGALAMTATQPLLAWQIARAPATGDAVLRRAVIAGLVLTFLLGAGAGGLLGGMQPPAGAGLPVVGWHWGGDLRPAHFIGMHAQQLLPLAALWLRRRRALDAFVAGYVLLWLLAMALGLHGAALSPLPPYDGMAR